MCRFRVRASKSMTEPMLLRLMPKMKYLNKTIKFQRQLAAQISSHLKEVDVEVVEAIEVIVVDAVDVEAVVAVTETTSITKMVAKMVIIEVIDATTIDAMTEMAKEATTVVEVIVTVEIETNRSLSTMRKKRKAGLSVNNLHLNLKLLLKTVRLNRVREVVVADVAVEIVEVEVVAEIAKDNSKEITSNIIIIPVETSTRKWLTNRKMERATKSRSTTETSASTTRMAST